MGDDGAERILAFAPEIQQRPAIKPDHVGERAGLVDCSALGQSAAAEQSEQVEFALRSHVVERIVVGEVDHLDDQSLAQTAKRFRQLCEGDLSERVNVFQCRRAQPRKAARCLRGHGAAWKSAAAAPSNDLMRAASGPLTSCRVRPPSPPPPFPPPSPTSSSTPPQSSPCP